jgi:copper chaperone CopZ
VTAARTEVVAVRGMQCGGCERSVSRAVEAVPGVGSARADFVAEEVEVTYDPGRTDLEAIRAAVRDAGFVPVQDPPGL